MVALAIGHNAERWVAGDQQPLSSKPSPLVIADDSIYDLLSERYPSDNTDGLELVGVVRIVGHDHAGIAIIAGSGNVQRTYKTGDVVREGAVLQEVFADRVILKIGDIHQELQLKKNSYGAKSTENANTGTTTVEFAETIKEPKTGLTTPWLRPNVISEAWVLDLFTKEFDGNFKLKDIKPGNIYEKFGFMEGDVVSRVNGQHVDSPEQIMALHQLLDKGAMMEVELVRDGSVFILHHDK